MKTIIRVLTIMDICLIISGVTLAILEWSGLSHTSTVAVGFLWLVLALASIERLSERKR